MLMEIRKLRNIILKLVAGHKVSALDIRWAMGFLAKLENEQTKRQS